MMVRAVRILSTTAVVLLVTMAPVAWSGAHAGAAAGPKTYYLALGDSLAYGDQPNGDVTQGYTNDFFHYLQSRGTAQLINMGCPGASSTSFITGEGCLAAHYPYTDSQLSAALSFLQQHPGQVSPVTLEIGANDALPLINPVACTLSTRWRTTLATFDTNFTTILSALHSALQTQGDLFVMNYYDPYQNQCQSNPQILSALQTLNQHIARDAAPFGVPVAPVFAFFGGAATPNPRICLYTWICSTTPDVHATRQGYAAIAAAFISVAGY